MKALSAIGRLLGVVLVALALFFFSVVGYRDLPLGVTHVVTVDPADRDAFVKANAEFLSNAVQTIKFHPEITFVITDHGLERTGEDDLRNAKLVANALNAAGIPWDRMTVARGVPSPTTYAEVTPRTYAEVAK
jgi:predicted small integral membrane protein